MKNSIYDNSPVQYSELRKGWMFQRKLEIFRDFLFTQASKNILEIGSGSGDFLSEIAKYTDANCVGYDLNDVYIQYSKEKYINKNISFINDFSQLKGRHFDVIYINDVIHHFPHEKDFIEKILELDFNYLFILEPNKYNPYIYYFQSHTPGERNFEPKIFEKELLKNLSILKKQYRFIFPNNIKKLNSFLYTLNGFLENNVFLGGSVQYIIKNKYIGK